MPEAGIARDPAAAFPFLFPASSETRGYLAVEERRGIDLTDPRQAMRMGMMT